VCLVVVSLRNILNFIFYFLGRVIAELNVDGVKSSYTKRPYDMSLSLLVYNISLVDRVQTYGPEFEMLLSSHNVNGENEYGNITPGRELFILLGNGTV
jgi:hypothetical protein